MQPPPPAAAASCAAAAPLLSLSRLSAAHRPTGLVTMTKKRRNSGR